MSNWIRSARHSWGRRSAAPAATITSSTRSRPAIITPWPASSRTPGPWSTPTSPSGWKSRCPSSPDQEAAIRAHDQVVAALEARIKAERGRTVAQGKTLALGRGAIGAGDLPGIVVDDTEARKVGDWKESRVRCPPSSAPATSTTTAAGKGEKTLTFQPDFPEAGKFEVWLAYTSGSNRSTAVPVTILGADGEKTVVVDMRAAPSIDGRFTSSASTASRRTARVM